MFLRLLVFILLAGFYVGRAQTPQASGLDSYRFAVHSITDETIRLLLVWEKSFILDNKLEESKAYDQLKQHVKKAIRDLRAIPVLPGDPGFHAAAVNLVKYVHNECNLTIAEIHDNPASHYTAQENKERFRNKRTGVVSSTRSEQERFLFAEALLLAKLGSPVVEPGFCSMVMDMVVDAKGGFTGYRGDFRGTRRDGEKEYEVLKMLPGAHKGCFLEQDDLPGMEYVLFESADSAEAARRAHEIAIKVLSCDLPGLEGYFEWRVDHRVLKNESPDIHLRYLIYHRISEGDLEPCKIMVTMRRPLGKYEAVLSFIRFK